ncbi:MAG: Gfo/Idh/MocA family oxidoreductase [Pseudomonadota bacterium]
MSDLLRVGLVGAGVFGGYHASKIAETKSVSFAGVFDADIGRAEALASTYQTEPIPSLQDIFAQSDAVIIATPAKTHGQLVSDALRADCHVLVEKPLALTAHEASILVDLATDRSRILQVGHQERVVCQAMGLFDIDEIPKRLTAIREGLPPQGGRNLDVSVVWDLMIHDIDLAHCLTGPGREVLSCEGPADQSLNSCTTDIAMNGCQARFVASRVADRRRRHLTLEYESGEIIVDFIERSLRNTTKHILDTDFADIVPDPLATADFAFFEACLGHFPCLIPGKQAAWAVATAERIEQMATSELGVALG